MKTMNDFLVFINELKDKSIKKYKLIGIVSSIVLSFDLFPKNENLKPFILESFQLKEQFKEYAYASRTVLIAKLTRMIFDADEKFYDVLRANMLLFLNNSLKEESGSNNRKNSNISDWIGSNNAR